MSTSKFEISKTTGVHARLAKLAGDYEGINKVWFEPPKIEDESPVRGTMKLILDGRFILYEYESSFKGNPISGIAIIGYNMANTAFEIAWADSYHMGTAIMFSESASDSNTFTVLGSYGSPGMAERWGWRTTIDDSQKDKLIITAYNVSPSGEEMIATETVYHRLQK